MFSFKGVYSRLQWLRANIMIAFLQIIMLFLLMSIYTDNDSVWGEFNINNFTEGFKNALHYGEVLPIVFSMVLIVAIILASYVGIAASVKRFHDTSRSGAWWLLQLVPIIGPFIVFIMNAFFKSVKENNIYLEDKNSKLYVQKLLVVAIVFLFFYFTEFMKQIMISGYFIDDIFYWGLLTQEFFVLSFFSLIFFGFRYDKCFNFELSVNVRMAILIMVALLTLVNLASDLYFAYLNAEGQGMSIKEYIVYNEYLTYSLSFIASFFIIYSAVTMKKFEKEKVQ